MRNSRKQKPTYLFLMVPSIKFGKFGAVILAVFLVSQAKQIPCFSGKYNLPKCNHFCVGLCVMECTLCLTNVTEWSLPFVAIVLMVGVGSIVKPGGPIDLCVYMADRSQGLAGLAGLAPRFVAPCPYALDRALRIIRVHGFNCKARTHKHNTSHPPHRHC